MKKIVLMTTVLMSFKLWAYGINDALKDVGLPQTPEHQANVRRLLGKFGGDPFLAARALKAELDAAISREVAAVAATDVKADRAAIASEALDSAAKGVKVEEAAASAARSQVALDTAKTLGYTDSEAEAAREAARRGGSSAEGVRSIAEERGRVIAERYGAASGGAGSASGGAGSLPSRFAVDARTKEAIEIKIIGDIAVANGVDAGQLALNVRYAQGTVAPEKFISLVKKEATKLRAGPTLVSRELRRMAIDYLREIGKLDKKADVRGIIDDEGTPQGGFVAFAENAEAIQTVRSWSDDKFALFPIYILCQAALSKVDEDNEETVLQYIVDRGEEDSEIFVNTLYTDRDPITKDAGFRSAVLDLYALNKIGKISVKGAADGTLKIYYKVTNKTPFSEAAVLRNGMTEDLITRWEGVTRAAAFGAPTTEQKANVRSSLISALYS